MISSVNKSILMRFYDSHNLDAIVAYPMLHPRKERKRVEVLWRRFRQTMSPDSASARMVRSVRFWRIFEDSPVWRYTWEVEPKAKLRLPVLQVKAPTAADAVVLYCEKVGALPVAVGEVDVAYIGDSEQRDTPQRRKAWRLCKQKVRSQMSSRERLFVTKALRGYSSKCAVASGASKAYKDYQKAYHEQRSIEDPNWAQKKRDAASAWLKQHPKANRQAVDRWIAADAERARAYKRANRLCRRIRYAKQAGIDPVPLEAALERLKDAESDRKARRKLTGKCERLLDFLAAKERTYAECCAELGMSLEQFEVMLALITDTTDIYESDDGMLGVIR